MTPLVAIQTLGLVYQRKSRKEAEADRLVMDSGQDIIVYDDVLAGILEEGEP